MQKGWFHNINVVVTVWGFLSILAISADFIGILPVYDIYYKKKTDITPELSVYPGGSIQLDARIWDPTTGNRIEYVSWNIRDSAGKQYPDVPSLKTVQLQLLPDFAGTMTVDVAAKLIDDDATLHGRGSFQIVQDRPFDLKKLAEGKFFIPSSLENMQLGRIQIYTGNATWVDGTISRESKDVVSVESEQAQFSTWDGQAFLRLVPATGGEATGKWDDPTVEYAVVTSARSGDPEEEK